MVQIRKGGGGGGAGIVSGGVGITGGNVTRTNSHMKNYSSYYYYCSRSGMALFKLLLLVIIVSQLVFLSYKVAVMVMIIPKPSSSSSKQSLSSMKTSSSSTISTTTPKHNNVRHISRSDIINSNPTPPQQQQQQLPEHEENEDEKEEATPPSQLDENEEIKSNEVVVEDLKQQQDSVLKRFGTGPAKEGYVVDLIGERQQEMKVLDTFQYVIRYLQTQLYPKYISTIESYIPLITDVERRSGAIHPCEYYEEPDVVVGTSTTMTAPRILPLMKSECAHIKDEIDLYGYNSVPFVRYYNPDPCHVDNDHHHNHPNLQSFEPGTAILLPVCKASPSYNKNLINDICFTHVFPFDVNHHELQSVPPIIIYDAATRTTTDLATNNKIPTISIEGCDVPCQYDTNLHADIMHDNDNTKITELGVVGTPWKIKQTLSDPYYNANVKIERTDYRRDVYYSTTSFKSSIPLSYYNFDTYNIRNTQPINFQSSKNAATYLLDTNCGYGNRHKWVAAVQVVLPVEAYGSCQNNVLQLEPGESIDTMEGRMALMRKNRIVLAFEAGTDRDHITNIVWEALLSGSVPAILGASNLEQHLPPHSAIFTTYYNSWDKFAAYVSEVANNETLWNTYHEWRTNEIILQQFEQRYAFVKSAPSPECRVCRWAYTKLYGLGFNHTTQVIQPTKLSRNICTKKISDVDMITKPFREQWYVANDNNDISNSIKDDDSDCTTSSSSSSNTITVFGREMGTKYDIERTIVAHDGIIDIWITKIVNYDDLVNGPLILRLNIDNVRNTEGASFRDVHTWITEASRTALMSSLAIQDEFVKVTIITNVVTPMKSPTEGVIDIEISPGHVKEELLQEGSQLRIRIILEDTTSIHDKLTEYFPSSFARRMMHDFIDPLEMYYAVTTHM